MNAKEKGKRTERELVRIFKKAGLNAKRVPLSGSTDFAKGDVVVEDLVIEVKRRKKGFKKLYDWLEGFDALAIREDKKGFLIVLPLEKFVELLGRGKG